MCSLVWINIGVNIEEDYEQYSYILNEKEILRTIFL